MCHLSARVSSPESFGRQSLTRGLILSLIIFIVGCSEPAAEPTTTPEPTATATSTPTPTPTATATATPTITPTPEPLTATEIFDLVSPSVVFIETPITTGSGVQIQDGYILTNAHVVWPYNKARIAYADGTELIDVPVVNVDRLTDLAVLGPVESLVPAMELIDGESVVIGADVYLIGYPSELEQFPQPALTRGLMSRVREWEALGITYFQSDATITGGQSGGVLVSEDGDVIGISGFSFGFGEFALVASAGDIALRVENLIAGENVDGLGDRSFNTASFGLPFAQTQLDTVWDSTMYLIDEPIGTEVEVEIESDVDAVATVYDPAGFSLAYADDNVSGKELITFEIEVEGPHMLDVWQYNTVPDRIAISSNVPLHEFEDPDGLSRVLAGDTITGHIDFPGDIDVFTISLEEGDKLHITVQSILIDPYLTVDYAGADFEQIVTDDDSGQGIFALDAEMTYLAPEDNPAYYLVVEDATGYATGGYVLTLDQPDETAPTPMAPLPTPTPIATELGDMISYQSYDELFYIELPAAWDNDEIVGVSGLASGMVGICNAVNACYIGFEAMVIILEEDLTMLDAVQITSEEYIQGTIDMFTADGTLYSRSTVTTTSGQTVDVLSFRDSTGSIEFRRLVYLDGENSRAFNATFILPDFEAIAEDIEANLASQVAILAALFTKNNEERDAVIDYSLRSFRVNE